jgi:hypothetical protein
MGSVAGDDLVMAGLADGDGAARGIELEIAVIAGAQIDRALGQRRLEALIVQRADVELGRAVEIEAAAADIDRRMGLGLGPDLIA